MVYAYDQWAQMPVKDLYDTQIMAMAINAAKDMYDKGEDAIKEFKKENEEFYSPTQSHNDFYNRNFNISGMLEDLYNRGIDPLRSKEGRALVQQYINTRPYQKLEKMKKSAEIYDTYLKNAAELDRQGKFNEAYEDFILNGKNINNLGENEMWDRYSPAEYKDLNQFTNHIFDKMDDEYLYSDPNTGLDWFGVSRDRRAQALTPLLGGLLSTDLGRFHYENSRKNAAAKLRRTPTEEEVMQQFKDDILTETNEFDHRNYKENPEYKRQRDFYYDDLKDKRAKARSLNNQLKLRANTPGYDSNGNPTTQGDYTSDEGVSLQEHGYNVALANAMGGDYTPQNISNRYGEAGKNINKVQIEFGKGLGENKQAFVDRFTTTDALSVEDLISWHGGKPTDIGFRANLGDIRKFKSKDDVITGTRGYEGTRTHTSGSIRDAVQNAIRDNKYVEVIPYGQTYGAQTKNNQFVTDAKVKVRIYNSSDPTGDYEDYDDVYYDTDWASEQAPSSYIDTPLNNFGFSNITSFGRTFNTDRSLLNRLRRGYDPANVYPVQHDIGSDTNATADRYKAGQSTKLGTSYK